MDKKVTIEEILAPYKESNESFYYAYLDCEPIEYIEGQIIENGVYSGYCLKDEYGNRWFTEYGIRGVEKGCYYIHNGEPKKMIPKPTYEQLRIIINMIDDKKLSLFNIERNWYEIQKEKYKSDGKTSMQ